MKKIILSMSYFFSGMFFIQAQVLFGTTNHGGAYGGGTINKFTLATNELNVVKSFEGLPSNPSNFLQASDGKLYGVTNSGGKNSVGIIFSFEPITSDYKTLKDFNKTDGETPSGLMQAINGKIYGTTTFGGSSNLGAIFSFDPLTSTYLKLKDFTDNDGANPSGNLVQANDGKLYGITDRGGNYESGVIFSYDPSSSTYTKLKDFDGFNGSYPRGSLLLASNGKLYGTTYSGGTHGAGVIFSFDPYSSSYTKYLDFDRIVGGYGNGGLIQVSDGKLYGTTETGGSSDKGVIFSFNPSDSTYQKLIDFDNAKGAYPRGNLLQASDGRLYGRTWSGGNSDFGVIFSYDPSTTTYKKLKDFKNSDGASPTDLIQTIDGRFCGLTNSGGHDSKGVIFSLDSSSFKFKILKDFSLNEGGSYVGGSLAQANDGKLYGMTYGGGINGVGVIFSFDPHTSTYSKLKDFDTTNGASPQGNLLMQASDGKLYGTAAGGNNGAGVIFSFDPFTSIYSKLKDFDSTNGRDPRGSLIQTDDGKFYGMTENGGSSDKGVIFSFDPSNYTYKKLIDLDFAKGAMPMGSLLQASDGKLYGMTTSGGTKEDYGSGVIFSFDPSTNVYIKLYDFEDTNGRFPSGSLCQASDGKFYGTTFSGGRYNFGVVFSYDPSTHTYKKLMDFYDIIGREPVGNLFQASNGKLYGMTEGGGSNNNAGVVFSVDPYTQTVTKIKDYNGDNGAFPFLGSAFIEVKDCTTDTTYYRDADNDGYGSFNDSIRACSQPAGYVKNSTDCNDNDAAIHAPVNYFRDVDGDGYGDASHSISVCEAVPPAGYVTNNYDCEDKVSPGHGRDEMVVMCHNGKEQCAKVNEINKKLQQGWTLGPCHGACGNGEATLPGKEHSFHHQYRFSNYPNPFTSTCIIQYELPFDSKVSIKVYDVSGRPVAVLVNDNKKAGVYTIDFKAGKLNKGLLLLKIIASSGDQQFEQTNKLVLVK